MDDRDSSPLIGPSKRTRRGQKFGIYAVTGFFSSFASSFRQDLSKSIHALKMSLALTLVLLLVLLDAPYLIFGTHVIWAIMTVIVVFEFTIGATLSKGCNRGTGTLLAGILAVVIAQVAHMTGGIFHPIIVGVSTFVIGGMVTFAKLSESMKSYEFGFRTFLITFSIIIVAEYRQGDPVNIAINRFLIILLGAAIGVSVNIFVFPSWAGEELHYFISNNFDSLAESLEVCVNEYLRGTILERVPSKIMMGLADDDPVYKGYRLALVSASKEESLAGFASWEPPHGRFRLLRYPWHQYVKVGSILRHCTYSVVALHGCLRSAIQAPMPTRMIFATELCRVSKECAEVLRKLGNQVRYMEKGDPATILDGVHDAVEHLQHSLYLHSYLLVHQDSGMLEEDKMEELPISVIPERRNGRNHLGTFVQPSIVGSNDASLKRLYSWPPMPDDGRKVLKDAVRVRVLESASALSLGTFATLLVEVAIRLDYLLEAVVELSELARFKEPKKERTNVVIVH